MAGMSRMVGIADEQASFMAAPDPMLGHVADATTPGTILERRYDRPVPFTRKRIAGTVGAALVIDLRPRGKAGSALPSSRGAAHVREPALESGESRSDRAGRISPAVTWAGRSDKAPRPQGRSRRANSWRRLGIEQRATRLKANGRRSRRLTSMPHSWAP